LPDGQKTFLLSSGIWLRSDYEAIA